METKSRPPVPETKVRKVNISFEEKYSDGYQNSTDIIKDYILSEKMDFYVSLYLSMPNTIGEAIEYLLDKLGLSKMKLAAQSTVGRNMIIKMAQGQLVLRVETVVMLCIGFHVPYFISMKLIEMSGHELSFSYKEHWYYRYVLRELQESLCNLKF